ncbi:hypothetical protein MKX03_036131, partial [Papaver bracteatum]
MVGHLASSYSVSCLNRYNQTYPNPNISQVPFPSTYQMIVDISQEGQFVQAEQAASSCSHTWDAFQLAHASFRLYCRQNNQVLPANNQSINPPKVTVPPMENGAGEGEEEDEEREGEDSRPAIKIYDDEVNVRFLVCGLPCTLDACLLGSLEDGLNALLNIEMRGNKIHNRVSAPPPPLQAATFSRGVVTMRCDVSTCSSAHISLLVSGSAQTCFDDQKSQLVHAPPDSEENKPYLSEPQRSAAVACGAAVFEVCMKVPAWASQVLRQLAPQVTYRSFVSLGIASIQGSSQGKESHFENAFPKCLPNWLKPPAPSRKRSEPCQELKVEEAENKEKEARSIDVCRPIVPVRKKVKIAAMRPIPHTRQHKMLFDILGAQHVIMNMATAFLAKSLIHRCICPANCYRLSLSLSVVCQIIVVILCFLLVRLRWDVRWNVKWDVPKSPYNDNFRLGKWSFVFLFLFWMHLNRLAMCENWISGCCNLCNAADLRWKHYAREGRDCY